MGEPTDTILENGSSTPELQVSQIGNQITDDEEEGI